MNPWLIAAGVWIAVTVMVVVWFSRGLFRRPPDPWEDEQ